MTDDEIKARADTFAAGVAAMNAVPPAQVDLSPIYDAADDVHFVSRETAERRFYNWYAAYGALVKPARILEIGVRRGYGAFALIKGAQGSVKSFLGIDSELDLPGQNAATREALGARTGCPVEILKADSVRHFPQLVPSFNLIHIDGDHSTYGAASDLLNAAPLAEPGGVIIVDDIDNAAVLQGVEIALAAFGQRVIRHDGGDVRKQALLFVRKPIPRLDFSIAAILWRPDGSSGSTSAFYRNWLRGLRDQGAAPDEKLVEQLFGLLSREYARTLQIAPTDKAGTVFDHFAGLVQQLPDANALYEEARPHVAYAAARLAKLTLPAAFAPPATLPDAFEPGTPAYGIMIWEITVNLAEVLERRVQTATRQAS